MTRSIERPVGGRRPAAFIVITLLFLSALPSVKGAPISGSAVTEERARRRAFWAAGPNRWRTTDPTPRFPSIRVISNPDGSLRDTRLVNALEWRREQRPDLFDKQFFRIAPTFERQAAADNVFDLREFLVRVVVPRTAAFQVLIPPDDYKAPILAEQGLDDAPQPSPVPEPSSVATALALIAGAGFWLRPRRLA